MPAVIRNMPMDDYQRLPALAASGVHTIVNECPARFWHDSPWNPSFIAENANHFDVGTALHLAVLEPHLLSERIAVLPFDSYQRKAARDLRDAAYAAGRTPLRQKDYDIVTGMALAIREHPEASALFRGGESEVTLLWEWAGVQCKARPDYLWRDGKTIVDAKTADSANPHAIARKAFTEGWHTRAAWYIEGAAAANGVRPDRYVFVVEEKDEPHMIQCYQLDERALAWGRQIIAEGLRIFRCCKERNEWPGYGAGVMSLELPSWAEFRLAEWEQSRDVSNRAAIEQSLKWLEP